MMSYMLAYYAKSLQYLESLAKMRKQEDFMRDRKRSDVFVKRTRYFLDLIGNPEKNFKFIHITGTAGKGSVSMMLHEILVASGKNTGLFTSPFSSSFIEKIQVNNEYISPSELYKIIEELKPFVKKTYDEGPHGGPSYFELSFAIALKYYQKMKCEWIVCEVGLGGSYDATNVIKNTAITAITNINLDHIRILGRTLTKIAKDKAGIIKPRSVFFTTEKRPKILSLFKKICLKKKAKMFAVNNLTSDVRYSDNEMSFEVAGFNGTFHSQMWGEHQLLNASLAISIANYLGIKKSAIHEGVWRARLPCRFEIMQKNPMVILDGAHNPSKMRGAVANLLKMKYKKLIVVLAVTEKKKIKKMFPRLLPLADYVIMTEFEHGERRCYSALELAEVGEKNVKKNTPVWCIKNRFEALNKALSLANKEDLVIVTGSFYLAGDLRKKWHSENFILKNLRCF